MHTHRNSPLSRSNSSRIPSPWQTRYFCAALCFALVYFPKQAAGDQAFVPGVSRLSRVGLADGKRVTISGCNLPASAFVAIHPRTGDILTADQQDRAVLHINRTNGMVTMISGVGVGSGPILTNAYGIAIGKDEAIAVVDGVLGSKAIFRVNPTTGDRTILSAGLNTSFPTGTGPAFQSPFGIVTESSGNFLVTDLNRNAIIRVDPISGNRTVCSGDPFGDNLGSGPELARPSGIALGADGTIFISDSGGNSSDGRILRINPATGDRTIIQNSILTGGSEIYGLAVTREGLIAAPHMNLINSHPAGGSIFGFDPVTGAQSYLDGLYRDIRAGDPPSTNTPSAGPFFYNPVGIAIDKQGNIIMGDVFLYSIFVVDSKTRDRSILPNSRVGTGVDFFTPAGTVIGTNGMILVADQGNYDVTTTNIYAVYREPVLLEVDPATGNRSVVSAGSNTSFQRGSGANFDHPNGIALEKSGTIVVADDSPVTSRIIRVNPFNGNRTIVSSESVGTGPLLKLPLGIGVEENGALVVVDQGTFSVVRIDPATGNRTVVSGASRGTGPPISYASGITVLEDGNLVICDSDSGILRVNSVSGDRSSIASRTRGTGAPFVEFEGVTRGRPGTLMAVQNTPPALFEIDIATGNRRILASPDSGSGPVLGVYPHCVAYQPDSVLQLEVRPLLDKGVFQFTISGGAGHNATVQTSTDLKNWTFLTNAPIGGTVYDVMTRRSAFYRAVSQ